MRKTTITYWIATGLFAFFMLGSAIPDILIMPEAVQGFKEIGYPAYLIPFVGWAKALGVIAILVPGFPRLKEWAYAGLFYDIFGAIYSVASSNKPLAMWAPMLIIPLTGAISYVYYHKKSRNALANAPTSQADPLTR